MELQLFHQKKINILIDNLEDTTINNKDLYAVKFVLIENILKIISVQEIGLLKTLIHRIQRIRSKKNNIYSKVNNLRKFFDNSI